MTSEKVTLYYREGTSDKVYSVQLEEKDGGWVVNFQFGRRGSTLTLGTKTKSPTIYPDAKAAYDKLVSEKTKKGYTPGEAGTPYLNAPKEDRATGTYPQLLVPASEELAEELLSDDHFGLQEKKDGKRILVRVEARITTAIPNIVTGINRNGLQVGIPTTVIDQLRYTDSALLDGEMIGDHYYVFDILEHNGKDLRYKGYIFRYTALRAFMQLMLDSPYVHVVPFTTGEEAKREAFAEFKNGGFEGVVFKKIDAVYTSGRPNIKEATSREQANQYKFKFVKTASVIVSRINNQRSVGIAVRETDGIQYVDLGDVTIPVNFDIPQTGQVVEVRYLYAYPGGKLIQTVFLGTRDDIDFTACTIDQLKYKREED